MKLEKIEVIKAFLASWLDYWILQAIGFTVLMLQEGASYSLLRWGLLSVYPFCLYLLRRKFTLFVSFGISHLSMAVLLCLIPADTKAEEICFCIYVIGYVIYSFYIRMKTEKWQDKAMPPLAAGIILTVLVFVQYYFERRDMEKIFVGFCVLYLMLYFVYSYLLEYIYFIKVNAGSAGYIPVKKMFVAGLRAVIPYSLLCGLVLILLSNASVLTIIFYKIKQVLVWMLGLVLEHAGTDSTYEEINQESQALQMADGMGRMEGEALWIWELMERIMAVVLIAVGVFVFVKISQLLLQALKRNFSKSRVQNTEIKEELMDKREKCQKRSSHESKDENKKHPLSAFSKKERIRRIYKRKIEHARKTAEYHSFLKEEKKKEIYLSDAATARECCESLNAIPLSELYEKARYSDFECDVKDVHSAKQWQ